jgi:hypothetical protein
MNSEKLLLVNKTKQGLILQVMQGNKTARKFIPKRGTLEIHVSEMSQYIQDMIETGSIRAVPIVE